MGLFSDKCECGRRVRKSALYCSGCGRPAPRAWATCGACGQQVGADSTFCWHCGQNLLAVAPPRLAEGRWARDPGDFAVRLDDTDVAGCLKKGIIVEHGTRAMLFQRGRYKGELPPGPHDLGGALRQLFSLDGTVPASIVLADAGDVDIEVEADDLYTKENFPLGARVRLTLKLAHPEALFVNLFKGRRRVTLAEVQAALADEARAVLQETLLHHRAADLHGNAALVDQIEADLRTGLARTLAAFGLDIVQVKFVAFSGEAYQRMQARDAETAIAEVRARQQEARVTLNARLRQSLTQDRMNDFKSGRDLEDFIRQTEHELGLKGVVRDDEMLALTARLQFGRDKEAVLRRLELAQLDDEAQRAQALADLLADEERRNLAHQNALQRDLQSAKNEAEKQKIALELKRLEAEHDYLEAQRGQTLLKQQLALEREDAAARIEIEAQRRRYDQEIEAATLKARSAASVTAVLSVLDGPQADRLTALERLRIQQGMTPDQLIMLAAEAAPDAARALAEKYRAEAAVSADRLAEADRRIREERETGERGADRIERVLNQAMLQMGQVAVTRATGDQQQTVVAGGGMAGPPLVVSPGAQTKPCAHCGARMRQVDQFCGNCGRKQ